MGSSRSGNSYCLFVFTFEYVVSCARCLLFAGFSVFGSKGCRGWVVGYHNQSFLFLFRSVKHGLFCVDCLCFILFCYFVLSEYLVFCFHDFGSAMHWRIANCTFLGRMLKSSSVLSVGASVVSWNRWISHFLWVTSPLVYLEVMAQFETAPTTDCYSVL